MTAAQSLSEMVPGIYQTDQQRQRAEFEAAQQRPSFIEGIGDAINSEWITSWLDRTAEVQSGTFDQSFKLTPELMQQLGQNLPEEYWPEFANATTLDQAIHIRDTYLDVAESRRKLASMGYTGIGLRMAAGMLDPVAIAATVATEGMAGPAVYGAKLTRLQRLWRGGLVAAGTGVLIDAPLVAMDPERQATDLIYTAVGAFALGGGAMSAFGGRELDDATKGLRKAIELGDVVESGIDITPEGKLYFKDVLDPAARKRVADNLIDSLDLPEDEMAAIKAMPPDQALVHYQKRVPDIVNNGPDLNFVDMPAPPKETGVIGRMRYSMSGRLMRSDVEGVRKLGRMLADDSLAGTRAGDVAHMSASEWVGHEYNVRMARFWRKGQSHVRDWMKENDTPFTKRWSAEEDFWTQVGHAVRREPGAWTEDTNINAMADFIRSQHAELLALGKRYGIKGFDDIPENPFYLMRIHNLQAIRESIAKYGWDNVTRLVKNSIISSSPDIEEKLADRISKGYLHNILNLDSDNYVRKARLFSRDYTEELAQSIREAVPEATADEIEQIINRIKPREPGANVGPRAKRRLDLDETMRAQDMLDESGNVIGKLSIEDLLENNAADLMNIYTRQILGSSAIAEVKRGFSTGADDVIESFEGLANRLTTEARKHGIADTPKFKSDLSRLETLYKSVLGVRLGGDGLAASAMRTLRAAQYIRVMNQVGFAQIAEVGMVLSQAGFRATVEQMPILSRIFSRARNGELNDEFLREIEAMWAVGTDRLRNQAINRIEATGGMVERTNSRLMNYLRRGQRFTNDISGMSTIDAAERRMAMAAGIQKWINIADSGKLPSARRLATMGLNETWARKIIDQLNKHATTVDGWFGRRARRVNIEGWDDLEAASKFIVAMDKWANRTIQTNDIGNLSQWMTTDLGRTLVQFRTFMSVAWEKQFLFNLRMSDWEAYSSWVGTMIFGGLAYTAQTYLNSLGVENPQRYREQRLSTAEIGKAAFQRAGWTSIMPMVADSVAPVMGAQSPFQYGRTTLLANDVLFGNPSMDFINNFPKAVRGVIAPARGDYQFSQQDLSAMRSVLPFQNMLGIKNFINAMGRDLPRNSQ